MGRLLKMNASKSNQIRNNTLMILISAVIVLVASANFLKNDSVNIFLYALAIAFCGYDFAIKAIEKLLSLKFDERIFIIAAVLITFVLKMQSTSAMIAILYNFGNILKEIALDYNENETEKNRKILPSKVSILGENENYLEFKPEDIKEGDILLVKPGERVPTDGIILEGISSLNTSALFGESKSVKAEVGMTALGGALNESGAIKVKATSVFEESAGYQVTRSFEAATQKKGKLEAFVLKYTKFYTLAALVIVAVLAVMAFLSKENETDYIIRTLVVLMASMSGSLTLFVPLFYKTSASAALKTGAIVSGGSVFEKLAGVKTMLYHKTGVITTGAMTMGDITAIHNYTADQVLNIAAIALSVSKTRIASIINAHAGNPKASVTDAEEYKSLGVSVTINDKTVLCGSAAFMKLKNVDITALPEVTVYTVVDGVAVGAIKIHDVLRPDAAATMKELKLTGIEKNILLTGDNNATAAAVKEKVAMDAYFAVLTPDEKVQKLAESKNAGYVTEADDGSEPTEDGTHFVIGSGNELILPDTDIVVTSGKISAIPKVFHIAQQAMLSFKINIAAAFLLKLIVILVGAFGIAAPWVAILIALCVDIAIAVGTVLNTTRLLTIK
ncbi:MAG: hypothetical protein BGN88_02575 [Clostridiales bacterium 43-6]|nr:MAG: hypothetical protein BGN88_02575 [Clostridiales bacterium 43-6]